MLFEELRIGPGWTASAPALWPRLYLSAAGSAGSVVAARTAAESSGTDSLSVVSGTSPAGSGAGVCTEAHWNQAGRTESTESEATG